MNKAVFLDRDGVINKAIIKNGKDCSPRSIDEFELVEDIIPAVKKLKENGYLIFVATNQPDIARKKLELAELDKMTQEIKNNLTIDEIMICPHDNHHGCGCRKPKPGMIFYAAKKFEIDLTKSYFVGDTIKDMQAAASAGCKSILIDAVYNQDVAGFKRVKNVSEAVKFIVSEGS